MKLAPLSCAFALVALLLSSCSSANLSQPERIEPMQVPGLTVSREEFVAQLPPQLLVPRPSNPEQNARLTAALQVLGLRGVTLTEVAGEAQHVRREPPTYPLNLRQMNVQGKAGFLLLVGTDGRVKAMYCYGATHQEFADEAARCLRRWVYTVGQVPSATTPALIEQPIVFSLM